MMSLTPRLNTGFSRRRGEETVVQVEEMYDIHQQEVKATKVVFVVDERWFNEMRGRIMTLGRSVEQGTRDG
jgi:hypothetical protein